MFKCKECSSQVSEEAAMCPKCGNNDPLYKKAIKEKKSAIFLVFCLSIFLFILSFKVSLWILIPAIGCSFGLLNVVLSLIELLKDQKDACFEIKN